MFASQRILDRFVEAAATFLESTHNSVASNTVVECLTSSCTTERYADLPNRNALVDQLADDVEARLGVTTKLMFKTPGYIHDQLQTFLDAYLDTMDGIYYTSDNTCTVGAVEQAA